jgi:cytochrome c553
MKKIILSITVLATIGAIVVSCNQDDKKNNGALIAGVSTPSQEQLIERGQYLVAIMACNDCHSPKKFGPNGPEFDSTRLLSGHPSDLPLAKIEKAMLKDWAMFNSNMTAIAGPWGVSFTGNLTSDETGIGNWTEAQFKNAIKGGWYKGIEGGRRLLPPMPWPLYAQALKDEDVSAIYAYLKTTKPIHNVVPAPIPPNEIK